MPLTAERVIGGLETTDLARSVFGHRCSFVVCRAAVAVCRLPFAVCRLPGCRAQWLAFVESASGRVCRRRDFFGHDSEPPSVRTDGDPAEAAWNESRDIQAGSPSERGSHVVREVGHLGDALVGHIQFGSRGHEKPAIRQNLEVPTAPNGAKEAVERSFRVDAHEPGFHAFIIGGCSVGGCGVVGFVAGLGGVGSGRVGFGAGLGAGFSGFRRKWLPAGSSRRS